MKKKTESGFNWGMSVVGGVVTCSATLTGSNDALEQAFAATSDDTGATGSSDGTLENTSRGIKAKIGFALLAVCTIFAGLV